MGLIKAAVAATSSVMAEQWKEFYYADNLTADTLMVRGSKITGDKSSNTKSDDNIITNGSTIAVSEDQAMLIVSSGKVTEVCSEPGEHIFSDGADSLLSGSGIKKIGKEIIKRIGFGGDVPPITHRVYYINMKEIPGNSFAISSPFKFTDDNLGLDMEGTLEASGLYSFRISDPEKIYKVLIGNVERNYKVSQFISQLQSEINSSFFKAVSIFSERGLRPSEIDGIVDEMSKKMVDFANESLKELRGIEIVSIGYDYFRLSDADANIIKNLQVLGKSTDTGHAAGMLTGATADAMRMASKNGE